MEQPIEEEEDSDDKTIEAFKFTKRPSSVQKYKRVPIESKIKLLIGLKDKKVAQKLSKNDKHKKDIEKIFVYSNDQKIKFEGRLDQIGNHKEEISNQVKKNLTGNILSILNDKMAKMYNSLIFRQDRMEEVERGMQSKK